MYLHIDLKRNVILTERNNINRLNFLKSADNVTTSSPPKTWDLPGTQTKSQEPWYNFKRLSNATTLPETTNSKSPWKNGIPIWENHLNCKNKTSKTNLGRGKLIRISTHWQFPPYFSRSPSPKKLLPKFNNNTTWATWHEPWVFQLFHGNPGIQQSNI